MKVRSKSYDVHQGWDRNPVESYHILKVRVYFFNCKDQNANPVFSTLKVESNFGLDFKLEVE